MKIFAFIFALIAPFFINFEKSSLGKIDNLSLLSLRDNSLTKEGSLGYHSKYNVSESVPKLFLNIHPLDLNPSEESKNSHLFKYSNTSLALDCYQKLPQYSIIAGLIEEYSYFLSVYYRLRCDNKNEYHDGSRCGDIPFLIDLLENKAEILNEKKSRKKLQCFTIESNIVSVQSRFYNSDGFIGRVTKTIEESEFVLVERSYLRRVISEYEQLLVSKTISYELYCISKLENNKEVEVDCYRLRLEIWILEQELILYSEEHFKRVLRFERLNDVI